MGSGGLARAAGLAAAGRAPAGAPQPVREAPGWFGVLITGIGNMHALGLGLLDMGWLSAKLVIFLFAAILGGIGGGKMRRRGKLVGSMISGAAPADAPKELEKLDKQISLIHMILPVLLLCILYLSIYGRLGGQ